MTQKCIDCGHTTHKAQATRCVLCKRPFALDGVRNAKLASIAVSNSESKAGRQSTGSKSEQLEFPDQRNWFVRSVHGRSVGVLVFAIIMILTSFSGYGFTRANMTLTGAPLGLVGTFLCVFSLVLFFATKRRNYPR